MIAQPRQKTAVFAAGLVAALAVAVAALAPPTHAAATRSASLCSTAHGVAAQIVQAVGISPNTKMTPAKLKALYLTVQKNEPALLQAASGSMRTNLRQVFGFINLVITDFKHANWQTAGMVQYFPSLVARAKAVQPSFAKVKVYFEKTCKFRNI